jgi:hypothetical protein
MDEKPERGPGSRESRLLSRMVPLGHVHATGDDAKRLAAV